MASSTQGQPAFNLWREPWIRVEWRSGDLSHVGVEEALLKAHEIGALQCRSPLADVGVMRLLTAVLQDIIRPMVVDDLCALWRARSHGLDAARVREFGAHYAERFDLFAAEAPFLQSADLPLQPRKGDKVKTVTYLAPERPSGTAVTHYCHGGEDRQVFCAACSAEGLVTIPAFATSGGAGIKPSINGVPPIYVLPTGATLYETLVSSLLCPEYQPDVADRTRDAPWWAREPRVGRSAEVTDVGYLHSLTFPARRVRLHPEQMEGPCTRCGRRTTWGVRSIVFEMGESRLKGAPFWRDPFAAYRMARGKTGKDPVAVRPVEGKALWREYGTLFLPQTEEGEGLRPRVLDQLAARDDALTGLFLGAPPAESYVLRCVGLRTDMKAKVFEWVDACLQLPAALLGDLDASVRIRSAIDLASTCATTLASVFRGTFGRSTKQERYHSLKGRMVADYWSGLAESFRQFVLVLGRDTSARARQDAGRVWAERVVDAARNVFEQASECIGEDGASLRERVQGQARLNAWLAKLRRERRYASDDQV
jgi:CRISPR system Cascade subunit CasA